MFEIAERIANLEFLQTDNSTDVTAVHTVGTHMAHTVECMQFLDAGLLGSTIAMGYSDLLTILQ